MFVTLDHFTVNIDRWLVLDRRLQLGLDAALWTLLILKVVLEYDIFGGAFRHLLLIIDQLFVFFLVLQLYSWGVLTVLLFVFGFDTTCIALIFRLLRLLLVIVVLVYLLHAAVT